MRPIRDRDPNKLHLITIRTDGARLFMVPSRPLNEIIGGIVARYQEILGILIYGYAFLGNHYHLLVSSPQSNLDEFEENINREIARRVNFNLKRKGHFWQRRYSDQIVVEEADALEALLYVTTNPTHHGLVKHPRSWPGLSCYWQLIKGEETSYSFTHYSKRVKSSSKDKVENSVKFHETKHTLRLTPLPQLAHLSEKERSDFLRAKIEQRVLELQKSKTFANPDSIINQRPGGIPKNVATSPRPSCYSKSPKARSLFRRELRFRMIQYKEASAAYRLGINGPPFPDFCFKPPLHRKPRMFPFKEYRLAA